MDQQLKPTIPFKDYFAKVLEHQKTLSEKRMRILMNWNFTIGTLDNTDWRREPTSSDFNFEYSDDYTSTVPTENVEDTFESEDEYQEYVFTSESEEDNEYYY
jgi:hypothetical protein